MILKKDDPFFALSAEVDATANPRLAIFPDGEPRQNPNSVGRLVCQVPFDALAQCEEAHGQPGTFGIDYAGKRMLLWPTPDRDYYAELEYNPPRMVLK